MVNTSKFVGVQLEVRIEDWISSLGEEIQNRLGIAGGMHTASSSFNAAAVAADLYVRCWEGNRIGLHELSGVRLRDDYSVQGFACMNSLQDLDIHQTCQLPSFCRLL